VTFEPNKIYWLTLLANSALIQPRGASTNDVWPILGGETCGGNTGIGWNLPFSLSADLVGVKFSSVGNA
jgi:hypothetical protein